MTLVISKGLTLDNGTRAAAIAGVSPTLDYRFAREKREIETVSLTDKLTYTGGNGTFVGSDGFIQPATTNVPRFDHDPLSRQSLGLLSEGSRENLLLRSEEFDNAAWVNVHSTESVNQTTSPAGTVTADRLIEDSGSVNPFLAQSANVVSATIYTFSCYAKEDPTSAKRYLMLLLATGQFGANIRITVNLATGTSQTQNSPLATSVTNVGNGWYRVSITSSATSTATSSPQIRIIDDPAGPLTTFTGDGTSGLFLWGAQLEAASTPSTYIPTTSAAVTRTADSAVIDGTGVITGTYTMVEKPAGCAVVSGTNINLQPGFTAERVMVFPAALDAGQITAIRGAM
jgi:fluoride ion exporter CrcB/FEX